MGCPYLREVVMVYCDALPQKKPVPADRLANSGHCACAGFQSCPVFLEAMARVKRASEPAPEPQSLATQRKERS